MSSPTPDEIIACKAARIRYRNERRAFRQVDRAWHCKRCGGWHPFGGA